MNPISAYLQDHLITIYFVYGLVFFSAGLALWLTCRRDTTGYRLSQASRPLVYFGVLHGIHEWIEMFQIIAAETDRTTPTVEQEAARVLILGASFLLLLAFGMLLLSPENTSRRQLMMPLVAFAALWLVSIAAARAILQPSPLELTQIADVLSRYSLAIPGALLAAWALMRQQRTFREQDMPQFGRYLVWSATAMLLYGVVGQAFVRGTALVPSNILNGQQFLAWFGIPVQLFRATVAAGFTFFLIRALDAFEVGRQRQLAAADRARVEAQQAQIEAERRNRQEVEQLNEDLRTTAHELALLLELANLLVASLPLEEQLRAALAELVQNLPDCYRGLVLLATADDEPPEVAAAVGFQLPAETSLYADTVTIGRHSIVTGLAICKRLDGVVFEYHPAVEEQRRTCEKYPNRMVVLSLPLLVQNTAIGSLAFAWPVEQARAPFSVAEFRLAFAAAQQLGLSIKHAHLVDEAQEREALLGNLLHQVVEAQEAERKRIARELHDATGQSLTALSLGLRGVENSLPGTTGKLGGRIHELGALSVQALGELRQIIADLRPSHLDDHGLVAAIRWYVGSFQQRTGIQVHLEVKDGERLPPEYETVLFRVAQEALTNVAKHAEATDAWVRLTFAGQLVTLEVEDNGQGFDARAVLAQRPAYAGWGLVGMQERVALLLGRVAFDSAPGQGARITVSVPVSGENSDG